jgi:hypothetical protein
MMERGFWGKLKNENSTDRDIDILVVARVQLSAEPHDGVRFIFVAVNQVVILLWVQQTFAIS